MDTQIRYSPKQFSKRLQELIRSSGKSQRQIAGETKMSTGTLSKYITGMCEPGLNALLCLAAYFNVSLDYLLGLSMNPDLQVEREYSVSIAVQGRFHVSVPIPNGMSKEEAVRFAIKRANEEATNADFGALEDIDWNVDHVEDDDENYIYPDE